MIRNGFRLYVICLWILGGTLKLFAADEDFLDKDKPFSHRAEKGLTSGKPSRLTFNGSLKTVGFIGSSSSETYDNFGVDQKVINNPLDAHFSGGFGFLWEFTPFTGVNLKLDTIYNASSSNFLTSTNPSVALKEFVAYSDIAGEFGNKYVSTKLSMGKVGFNRTSFTGVDVLGTQLSSRHKQSDQLNVKLELGTRKAFPMQMLFASDMDFGINTQYNTLNWNNKGSSYLVQLKSQNYNILDVMTLSWNTYYGYSRTATKDHYVLNPPSINADNMNMLANYLNKKKHTAGATIGVSIPIGDLITISTSAAVEYNTWKFVGPDMPAPVAPDPLASTPVASNPVLALAPLKEKGQNFQSFEWHVDAKMELNNILKVELAARQDAYNHVEYARLNNKDPYTEFITGFAVEYLQLKERTKLTFHLGVGASFGSLFSSPEYKRARHGVATQIYSGYALNDKKKAAIKGIANPKAGNQLSADLGVGYHPVKGASIYLGYQYGKYGIKDYLNNTAADFKGSPGQVYVTAKYQW